MIGYTIRRLIQAVIVTLLVTLGIFLLLHVLPGGPARTILGPRANQVQIAQFNHDNGFDAPLPVQYWNYLSNLAHGQWGTSLRSGQGVGEILIRDIPKTLLLVGLSYAVAIVVAIPLGIYQAVRRNKIDDYVLTSASFIFYSMPVFWLGILLIGVFSFTLHLLPPEGPQGETVGDLLGQMSAIILPVATLAL